MNEIPKFSITVHADDRKLIAELSVLAHICQPENTRQICIQGQIGGTWQRNGHQANFHFSSPDHRQEFIETAEKLVAPDWKIKDQRNDSAEKPGVFQQGFLAWKGTKTCFVEITSGTDYRRSGWRRFRIIENASPGAEGEALLETKRPRLRF
jgi:hypothetical protein